MYMAKRVEHRGTLPLLLPGTLMDATSLGYIFS